MINKNIVIGKICSAHGVRGEVKIFPITDNVRRFSKLKKCLLVKEDGTEIKEMTVRATRVDKEFVLAFFEGLDDRDEAMKLKGLYIAVDRENAVKLPKDTYFIADLLGITLVDDDLGELGTINDVYETGANFIISCKRKGKPDLQIPYLKVICYETNIEEGYMKVRLPDGLYEIYEPKKKKENNGKKNQSKGE